jgi:hypothetical protein
VTENVTPPEYAVACQWCGAEKGAPCVDAHLNPIVGVHTTRRLDFERGLQT